LFLLQIRQPLSLNAKHHGHVSPLVAVLVFRQCPVNFTPSSFYQCSGLATMFNAGL
jgi:hypothetical protein